MADDDDDNGPDWEFVDGASFVLDIPDRIPALWGQGTDVLWAEGESLMIAGGMGLGKTTLAGLLMRAQLSPIYDEVLGLPVAKRPGTILYLAMDRPAQIARSLHRQFNEHQRKVLSERLKVWKGPPPGDVAESPELLAKLAAAAGADTVYLDSIKDAALGLSDDEVGAGYNRARQILLAEGKELAELHHVVKRGVGGGAPTSVIDIYGSAWITNGTGSIILLTGKPGDPIVGFHHLRSPANEVGPFSLLHDETVGAMGVYTATDLVELVAAMAPEGLTARAAAVAIFGTTKPTDAQIEKARRRLNKKVAEGDLRCVDAVRGDGTPTMWFLP